MNKRLKKWIIFAFGAGLIFITLGRAFERPKIGVIENFEEARPATARSELADWLLEEGFRDAKAKRFNNALQGVLLARVMDESKGRDLPSVILQEKEAFTRNIKDMADDARRGADLSREVRLRTLLGRIQ